MERQMMAARCLFHCTDCGPVMRWRAEDLVKLKAWVEPPVLRMSQCGGLLCEKGFGSSKFSLQGSRFGVKQAANKSSNSPVSDWSIVSAACSMCSTRACLCPVQFFSLFYLWRSRQQRATANHQPPFDSSLSVLFCLTIKTTADMVFIWTSRQLRHQCPSKPGVSKLFHCGPI